MTKVDVPIELPSQWTAEASVFGIVIEARNSGGDFIGAVTVDEAIRGYALGFSHVRKNIDRSSSYGGLGWKAKLYRDAVAELQRVSA